MSRRPGRLSPVRRPGSASKTSDSAIFRRRNRPYRPSRAPTTKGMRQPNEDICSLESTVVSRTPRPVASMVPRATPIHGVDAHSPRLSGRGDLGQVGERDAGLATVGQALDQPGQQQDHARPTRRLVEGGHHGDHQAAQCGQQDGQGQAESPALLRSEINPNSHPPMGRIRNPTAKTARVESRRGDGILRTEDLGGEERGEDRVDVPVEPFDGVADVDGDEVLSGASEQGRCARGWVRVADDGTGPSAASWM